MERIVEVSGPSGLRLVKGFHDEAIKGEWADSEAAVLNVTQTLLGTPPINFANSTWDISSLKRCTRRNSPKELALRFVLMFVHLSNHISGRCNPGKDPIVS